MAKASWTPQDIALAMTISEYRCMRALEQNIPNFMAILNCFDCVLADIVSTKTARQMIAALKQEGLIANDKGKTYKITSLGHQVMREARALLGIDKL
jgi:predicted transcriptional regulator